MINKQYSLIKIIIYLLILLIPVSGAFEFLVSVGIQPSFGITFLKIPREVLMVLLCLVSLRNLLKPGFSVGLTLFLISLTILNFISFFFSNNIEIGVFGLRWALPFFILPLIYRDVDQHFLHKLSKALSIIISLNLICQVYQMFAMNAYRGLNQFGLSGRVSGFFALPSIAGVFAAFTLFFIIYFPPFKNKKVSLIFKILAMISIFISMSSTGVGLLFVITFLPYLFKSRYKVIILFVLLPLSFVVINNLDVLTGRNEGSSVSSFSTRVGIFLTQINNSQIISFGDFGNATNGAVGSDRRAEVASQAFIVDSLYTTVLVNYGLFPFIMFISTIIIIGSYVFLASNDPRLKIFYIMITLSSASLITTEIYPVNIFIIILGAYFLKLNIQNVDHPVAKRYLGIENSNSLYCD